MDADGPALARAGRAGLRAVLRRRAAERDAVYHQGTVWPWLAGPFVEAWVRVRGNTAEAKAKAREMFLAPRLSRLDFAGLHHVPEIADAERPHRARLSLSGLVPRRSAAGGAHGSLAAARPQRTSASKTIIIISQGSDCATGTLLIPPAAAKLAFFFATRLDPEKIHSTNSL